MDNKENIIKDIYNNFYGSMVDTYKDAIKKDKSITYQDVKQWFEKNIPRLNNVRGYNSFIASSRYQEYEMDLFFINYFKDQFITIGIIMIDIFTKYITVVPLPSKSEGDVLDGIEEAIHNMGHKPKVVYSDDEGSLNGKSVQKYFKDHHIQHIVTRGHAASAERSIRTIKSLIDRRMQGKPEGTQWTDANILNNALVTYNYKMISRPTGYTPNDARKPENEINVKINLETKAKHTRTYKPVEVGDAVKVYRKKKPGFDKEHVSVWSDKNYKVDKIEEVNNQKLYHLAGYPKPLIRADIFKN